MNKQKKLSAGFDSLLTSTNTKKEQFKGGEEKEKMTTANFRIPVSLHKKLKMLAIDKNMTLMDLIAESIQEYINNHR